MRRVTCAILRFSCLYILVIWAASYATVGVMVNKGISMGKKPLVTNMWRCSFTCMLFLLFLINISNGATWVARSVNTDKNLYSVYFSDRGHGWIAGASTMLRTDDSGKTWSVIAMQDGYYTQVAFCDSLQGIVAGTKTLYDSVGKSSFNLAFGRVTADGGRNWLDTISGLARFYEVGGLAWAGGREWWLGANYALPEGNEYQGFWGTVMSAKIPTGNWTGRGPDYLAPGTSPVTVLKDDGYGRVWIGTLTGQVLTTSDTGKTWTTMADTLGFSKLQSIGDAGIRAIAIADSHIIWVAGDSGKIARITHEGQILKKAISYNQASIFGIASAGNGIGFAVGGNGNILRTNDNGWTWTKCDTGNANELNSIWLLDSSNGWAVGNNGKILALSGNAESIIKMCRSQDAAISLIVSQKEQNLFISFDKTSVGSGKAIITDLKGEILALATYPPGSRQVVLKLRYCRSDAKKRLVKQIYILHLKDEKQNVTRVIQTK